MNDCNATDGSPGLSDSAIDIERPEDLVSFLRARGIVASHEQPVLRTLKGGVSNRTVLVQCSGRAGFVVKQALSRLRVTVEWYADPQRIHREARALEYLGRLCPHGSIPALLFEDHREHLIGMQAVPEPHYNWKNMLLDGHVSLDHIGTIRISARGNSLQVLGGSRSRTERVCRPFVF